MEISIYTGKYGGGAFVLVYLFFLFILGLPIVVAEFSVGRASQRSIATSFNKLEPKGTNGIATVILEWQVIIC